MTNNLDNKSRDLLQLRSIIKYTLYMIVIAVLVAEIGFAVSTWFSVQTAGGLIGGVIFVVFLSYTFERTTFGQSTEENFQQHRLLMTLLVVVLITVGGGIVSSVVSFSRVFLLTFILGMIGGVFISTE
ncbi:hypothetical protein [Natronococcus sp. A-GB7]|uniref:hypothetical protein n=1 Tax=Natronococcus sp. A-GB7 TaxID=3037649 RepID=UPI00241F5D88|nr:hypothetical protein [Natronococcus sp. A-GB7]MDG5821798.1 hypothetical protein [Natronococcus sp. A-GB7]